MYVILAFIVAMALNIVFTLMFGTTFIPGGDGETNDIVMILSMTNATIVASVVYIGIVLNRLEKKLDKKDS